MDLYVLGMFYELEDNGLDLEPPAPFKKACHPFQIRLKNTAAFNTASPKSLISAGFASLGLGMFALFRPSPLILFSLAERLWFISPYLDNYLIIVFICICVWSSIVLFVLFVLGIIQILSLKIKNRKILLLHPWGLMFLYLDVVVWLSLAVSLNIKISNQDAVDSHTFYIVSHSIFFFSWIYVESIIYWLGYHVYATYFIAAELTVIEKFY